MLTPDEEVIRDLMEESRTNFQDWEINQILDSLRMCSNLLQSKKGEAALKRSVDKSMEIINNKRR